MMRDFLSNPKDWRGWEFLKPRIERMNRDLERGGLGWSRVPKNGGIRRTQSSGQACGRFFSSHWLFKPGGQKVAIVGENRGSVEGTAGENIEFPPNDEENTISVEEKRAIVEEIGVFVGDIALKNEGFAESVGGIGRPLKKSQALTKNVVASLKEFSAPSAKSRITADASPAAVMIGSLSMRVIRTVAGWEKGSAIPVQNNLLENDHTLTTFARWISP
jgi:hypothetical protein